MRAGSCNRIPAFRACTPSCFGGSALYLMPRLPCYSTQLVTDASSFSLGFLINFSPSTFYSSFQILKCNSIQRSGRRSYLFVSCSKYLISIHHVPLYIVGDFALYRFFIVRFPLSFPPSLFHCAFPVFRAHFLSEFSPPFCLIPIFHFPFPVVHFVFFIIHCQFSAVFSLLPVFVFCFLFSFFHFFSPGFFSSFPFFFLPFPSSSVDVSIFNPLSPVLDIYIFYFIFHVRFCRSQPSIFSFSSFNSISRFSISVFHTRYELFFI